MSGEIRVRNQGRIWKGRVIVKEEAERGWLLRLREAMLEKQIGYGKYLPG